MSGKSKPRARRKSYSPTYRRDAAHLVIDTGRPIARVAREIGVGEALLGRWVATERAHDDDPTPALDLDERDELERLRVEVAELRMDRGSEKSGGLLRLREPEPVEAYRVMDTEKASFEIARMARLLEVSRSGYYQKLWSLLKVMASLKWPLRRRPGVPGDEHP